MKRRPERWQAVFFDFDGTLTRPGALDFAAIKRALGCPPQSAILEFIEALPDTAARREASDRLDRFETEAAVGSLPNAGAESLVAWLKSTGLPMGIISRNSRASVQRALDNFKGLTSEDFAVIISRDDPVAPKPSGAAVTAMAQRLGVPCSAVLMVGDFRFDIEAGRRAGAVTVFLDNGDPTLDDAGSDHRISTLEQLKDLVRRGLPLPAGKLPNDLLDGYLKALAVSDDSLLIRPGVGEDTAAVSLGDAEVLVVTSDPITFATDAIGTYTVQVNANDMATSGARPRWLLTTLLMPPGTTPMAIEGVLADLNRAAAAVGVSLCGGHTEVTDAVTRPVVAGTMAGTVARSGLMDKRRMRPGDRVLLTKAVSVEGTAIIAREFGRQLMDAGLSASELDACRGFLDRISVLPEARIAVGEPAVTALHDVTEGGVATALQELAAAGGHDIQIDLDRIPVYTETRRVCRLMGIDPLGLIGSGSLLICCGPPSVSGLIEELAADGIPATTVGTVTGAGGKIMARKRGRPAVWPQFEVDEITRLF
jgi:hydrogenase expression/formation protein HypE